MKSVVLPNGLSIAEINKYETKFLYEEIFVQNEYVKHGIEISPGDVIIDAGANIGLFALFALTKFDPAQIYCFEPAPNCVKALRVNLAEWRDRVSINELALSDAKGLAEFTYYPGYSIMSGLHAEMNRDLDVLKAGAKTQLSRSASFDIDERMIDIMTDGKLEDSISFPCQVTTLSDVIADYKISTVNLLKIDVERAEGAILRGVGEGNWNKIQQIVVEVHDQGDREHEKMHDLLKGKGYETTLWNEDTLEESAIYNISARRR